MATNLDAARPLAVELAAFERERARLLREHAGKFAIFKGDDFEGSFDSFEVAYREGLKLWGPVPFLVKQVLPEDLKAVAPALTLGLIRANP